MVEDSWVIGAYIQGVFGGEGILVGGNRIINFFSKQAAWSRCIYTVNLW
jgi:hypothetical protein